MSREIEPLIRTNFLAFAMKAFATLNRGKRLVPHPYVNLLVNHLQRVADGEIKRFVIALPPRHLKTFLGSICLAAWILANNPSAKILLISYGQELADKIAFAIRAILQSEWFARIFKTRVAKNRSRVMDFLTTDGGGVRSVSIDGGVTGLGADFIIVDDPLQIGDCENVRQLERVVDLFDSEIRTRLDHPKKGCIVIIAHRLSEDDLSGHVMREGGWRQLRLPLIAPRARNYDLGNGEIWHRKQGELLRPDAFTWRDIKKLRSVKRPDFETLQQQNPDGRDRLQIKAKHFPTFSPVSLPADLAVVLSIDPGQKGGPTHSFGVIQAWATYGGAYQLLEQWREQARYREFRSEVRRFIRKYRPSVVAIEGTGQGPALTSDIRTKVGMEVVLITPVGSKVDRLRKHRQAIRSGRVQLPENAPWCDEFLKEVELFPYAPFDDQVDAMTQYLSWISEHPNPKRRPPRALLTGILNSSGAAMSTSSYPPPAMQVPGGVLARRTNKRRW